MMRTPLPPDFVDRPFWQRRWIDLLVFLHIKSVKTVCCESFRKGKLACKGCATLHDVNSTNPWYRFLGRWAKRRLGAAERSAQQMAFAEDLVRTRIPGYRKGLKKLASEHSFHVRNLLKEAGETEEVCLAGLLHDIIEDGGATQTSLRAAGFSERVITLVDLCSHPLHVEDGDARWICMMARLIQANDRDAWIIKIADLLSNLEDVHGMPPERMAWMFTVKGPLLLKCTRTLLGTVSLWQQLDVRVQKR